MAVGTKETKEIIDFAKGLVRVVKSAQDDGSVNLLDLTKLMTLVPLIGPAFLGLNEIPSELKDLDQAEATELVAYVMADLGVTDARAMNIIDASFKLALAGYNLYSVVYPGEPKPAA